MAWRSRFWRGCVICWVAIGIIACKERSQPQSAAQRPEQKAAQPAPQQAQVETEESKSCRVFVQEFYDWYVAPVKTDKQHPDGNLDEDDVLGLKRRLFSPRLFNLLKRDSDVQARHPGEITGLDFDPLTASQDNSPNFQVQSVSIRADDCRTVVWGMDSGTHRETLEPEARRKDGQWLFVNFHYSYYKADGKTKEYPDDDLVHMLIEEQQEETRLSRNGAQK